MIVQDLFKKIEEQLEAHPDRITITSEEYGFLRTYVPPAEELLYGVNDFEDRFGLFGIQVYVED